MSNLEEEDLREDGVIKGKAKPIIYTAILGLLGLLIIGVDALIRFVL